MQQLQLISASQFTVTNRWLPVPPSVPSTSSEQVPHNSSTVQLTNNSPISGMNLRILRTMEHVRADVAHLSIKMDRVLARLDQMASNGKEVQELPEDVSLPLADLTALGELERLLQNEATARALVSRLGLIGGESVKDTTTRIMTSVVSHPLALQLNWMGKGEKTGFSTLCLKEVIFKAVRRNPEIHKATDNDIEKCAKDWLRGASDRNGARKLRYMRAAAAAAASSSTTEMPDQ